MIAPPMIRRRSLLAGLSALVVSRACRAAPVVLKPGEVLRGRFTQERHLKGFASPVMSEGSFVLRAGAGLLWRVQTPFATTTVITPAGLLQVADGRELTRLPASRIPFLARLFDLMNALMVGDWSQLDPLFEVKREQKNGREKLVLTPRRPDEMSVSRIQSISVTLGRFAEAVELRRLDGDFDRLAFSDQAVSSDPLSPDEVALFQAARA